MLSLTRQGLPALRGDSSENHSAYGAYILAPGSNDRQVTLIASGSEVQVALEAMTMLEADGIPTAVVSMPCWELFMEQPPNYRDEVMGPGALHMVLEAGSPFGWTRWAGLDGGVIGMEDFGASAPAKDLFKHFGLTAEAAVAAVKARL